MSVAPPGDAPQSSGTAVARDSDLPPPLESLNGVSGSGLPSPPSTTPTTGEEQALELHEVIELQTFSERKAWIEQKIKVFKLSILLAMVAHLLPVPREDAPNRGIRRLGCYTRLCGGCPRFTHAGRIKAVDDRTRCY